MSPRERRWSVRGIARLLAQSGHRPATAPTPAPVLHGLPPWPYGDAPTAREALAQARGLALALDPGARAVEIFGADALWANGRSWGWLCSFVLPTVRAELHVDLLADSEDGETAQPRLRERLRPLGQPGEAAQILMHEGVFSRAQLEAHEAGVLAQPGLPESFMDSPDVLRWAEAQGADLVDGSGYLNLHGRVVDGVAEWRFTDLRGLVYRRPMA